MMKAMLIHNSFLNLYFQLKPKATLEPKPSFLIIEDDADILASLTASLKDRGYEALGINDPLHLEAALKAITPNVWLVDYFLSKKANGLEINTDQLGCCAFILMSAYPQAKVLAQELGISYLEKPFSLDQLISLSHQAITDAAMV